MRKIALFGEAPRAACVQRARRREVAAERLLDDDARALAVQPRAGQALDHRREQRGGIAR